jgi:ERCC4-related helicase
VIRLHEELVSDCARQIERNLCATARTPKLHRAELMRYVHRPLLRRLDHPVEVVTGAHSMLLLYLENAFATYDLMADPYVLELQRQRQEGHDISTQSQKVVLSGKTYCKDQLKTLLAKAKAMAEELGVSPMEWYVHQCILAFEKSVRMSSSQLFDLSFNEKEHLLRILQQIPYPVAPSNSIISLANISRKVELLVQLLITEAKETPNFTGLIFVEQRVWVAALAEILSVHPQTKELFSVGTFVGTSQSTKRKANIATFAEPKNQQTTLDDFRAGKTNLILATSVLEEGIDVSSCNLVVCFERPKNLKSFVQRRGRARKQESKYWIFVPEVGGGRPPESWESLEEEMKAAYLDDMRQVHLAEEKELEEEVGHRSYRVPTTG